jgi:hypothetical protein
VFVQSAALSPLPQSDAFVAATNLADLSVNLKHDAVVVVAVVDQDHNIFPWLFIYSKFISRRAREDLEVSMFLRTRCECAVVARSQTGGSGVWKALGGPDLEHLYERLSPSPRLKAPSDTLAETANPLK